MKAKRILAFALVLAVSFSALLCIPAQAANIKTTPEVPVVYVHGFMGCSLYGGLDTGAPHQIFSPTEEKITATVEAAILPVTEFLAHADWDKFVDDAGPVMYGLLGETFCDTNGDPLPGTGVDWEYPSKEEINSRTETTFTYDWRLSPVLLGQQLADYIDYVLECTGSDKVALICHSYGNCVGMAYVAQYGVSKLDCFVFNASAFYGETYTGKLLSGQLHISGKMLLNYLKSSAFYNNDGGAALCDLLELLFVADSVEDIANDGIDKVGDKIARDVLAPWFAGYCSIWAMVPDEYYEASREYIFNNLFADTDYSGLEAKLDEFDRVVRSRRDEILDEIETINHGVVARYNLQMAPVAAGCDAISDNTIDTKYASFGATCCNYGETLPSGYKQAALTDVNYISPDNMIDASTCRFPTKTWFVKDMPHDHDYGDIEELFYRIIANDGYDVNTDPDYPQWLVYNDDTEHVSAYATAPVVEQSIILRILDFFKMIREWFLAFIGF